jgi:Domain of unknown function (DUF397)
MGGQPERYSSITWRKSRHSGPDQGCVEIASLTAFVLVRDSHDRSGPMIVLTADRWQRLVRRIRGLHMDFG